MYTCTLLKGNMSLGGMFARCIGNRYMLDTYIYALPLMFRVIYLYAQSFLCFWILRMYIISCSAWLCRQNIKSHFRWLNATADVMHYMYVICQVAHKQ